MRSGEIIVIQIRDDFFVVPRKKLFSFFFFDPRLNSLIDLIQLLNGFHTTT